MQVEVPTAVASSIVDAARHLAARGWTPATSSNFSMRVDAETIAMTRSGGDKGCLEPADILAIRRDGTPYDAELKPSAECALHVQIYRRFEQARAVLHTHSRSQSVASRLFAGQGSVRLEGWELQKAVTGIDSHASLVELPVFGNSQHMPDIMAEVDAWLDSGKPLHGYLIEGHGLYTWGRSMGEARRHIEALEFLLSCELDLIRLGATSQPRKSRT